ncbi:MAG TPA: M48 family metallopeptidase [Bacteroidales bacterium]|nr:M48 family metallopeptidase [Bacteroidales bacterium]HNS47851.1 M48 family metallopeptidase [Bacteroidales bacterium]
MKTHSVKSAFFWMTLLLLVGCTTVPITGRKRVNLIPSELMIPMALQEYSAFLQANPALPATDERVIPVKTVGNNISNAVMQFMYDNDMKKEAEKFQWEFNVVNEETVNAWCMPGGKIVFYTGILPVAGDANGIATIMGHEIAHAFAKHGEERMTQQLAILVGGLGLEYALRNEPQTTNDIFLTAFGIGSQLGQLAFSRKHEYEADKLGMVFMALGGYDPSNCITFWQKMSQQSGSSQLPEFLSTHPSDQNRIAAMQEYLPTALKYYTGQAKGSGTKGSGTKSTGGGTIKL